MTSFSARYERGEREEVWRELRGLGPAALDEAHRDDAEAVAHVMAVRARHNVDLLAARLAESGFDFRGNDDDRLDRPGHVPPTEDAPALVEWMAQRFGPIPLTVAAWIRVVGDVWFVGDHPDWPTSDLADPLVVEFEYSSYAGSDVRAHYESELEYQAGGRLVNDEPEPFQLYFAPDDFHKANISGGDPYGVQMTGPVVDGLCTQSGDYFVDYLNDAFAAGGFPGALVSEGCEEPPTGLRERLAEGLLRL